VIEREKKKNSDVSSAKHDKGRFEDCKWITGSCRSKDRQYNTFFVVCNGDIGGMDSLFIKT
jgi:hypothetical protein